jgi:hypothetical protein
MTTDTERAAEMLGRLRFHLRRLRTSLRLCRDAELTHARVNNHGAEP